MWWDARGKKTAVTISKAELAVVQIHPLPGGSLSQGVGQNPLGVMTKPPSTTSLGL